MDNPNMNLRRCYFCGKAFVSPSRTMVCPDCREKLEQLYFQVRDLLRDSPGTPPTVRGIAEELGVDERMVQLLVDEGWIQRNIDDSTHCSLCGKPIKNGRLCEDCARKMDYTKSGGDRNRNPRNPFGGARSSLHASDRYRRDRRHR
ncbi:MAG: GntR family transcriptional regulator [Synergistales bacterium]|nr:GntR family transcriptional regulator [Synergistales bacterium]